MKIDYIGNGAYCYANSISMLLKTIGEEVLPSEIEVLSGVGLGACILKGTELLFFSWGVPDIGIDNALSILGFENSRKNVSKNKKPPIDNLKVDLENSPVVIGPLDMGHLVYNPRHKFLSGADHFVLGHKIDEKGLHLHDPAGFPYVQLTIKNFKLAWDAEVGYCKDNYSYWTPPKRLTNPKSEEIYQKAIELFKKLYNHCDKRTKEEGWITGKDAIMFTSKRAKKGELDRDEIGHLTYFALPLGTKRALDYASFFDSRDKKLSELKVKQAKLFGETHTLAVRGEWNKFSGILGKLAEVENEFKETLMEVV